MIISPKTLGGVAKPLKEEAADNVCWELGHQALNFLAPHMGVSFPPHSTLIEKLKLLIFKIYPHKTLQDVVLLLSQRIKVIDYYEELAKLEEVEELIEQHDKKDFEEEKKDAQCKLTEHENYKEEWFKLKQSTMPDEGEKNRRRYQSSNQYALGDNADV